MIGDFSSLTANPFDARKTARLRNVFALIAEIFAPVSTKARIWKPATEVDRVGREGEWWKRLEISQIYSALTENPVTGEGSASWCLVSAAGLPRGSVPAADAAGDGSAAAAGSSLRVVLRMLAEERRRTAAQSVRSSPWAEIGASCSREFSGLRRIEVAAAAAAEVAAAAAAEALAVMRSSPCLFSSACPPSNNH